MILNFFGKKKEEENRQFQVAADSERGSQKKKKSIMEKAMKGLGILLSEAIIVLLTAKIT